MFETTTREVLSGECTVDKEKQKKGKCVQLITIQCLHGSKCFNTFAYY